MRPPALPPFGMEFCPYHGEFDPHELSGDCPECVDELDWDEIEDVLSGVDLHL